VALRDAIDLVARRFDCPPDDAERWIVGKAQAGRLRARGVTSQGDHVSLLPAAWRGTVDWNPGLLSFLHGSVRVTVHKVMLDPEGLVAAGVLPKEDRYITFVMPSTSQETSQELAHLPIDPDVKMPAAVQAAIARAKAAHREFRKSRRKLKLIKGSAGGPSSMEVGPMEIVDNKEDRDRRDTAFSNLAKNRKRKSAFMLRRQRVVLAIVDRHRGAGVRFGTSLHSRMNKLVRKDLNRWAARYRVNPLTPEAVRYILRQIKGLVF
jgi:hypothetical protein